MRYKISVIRLDFFACVMVLQLIRSGDVNTRLSFRIQI